MKVLKIATDAAPELVEIPNELHALQEAVGGHIEVVRLMTEGDLMIVDEEGLIKGYKPNKVATILAHQPICGDALVVSEQGEDFGDVDPEICEFAAYIKDCLEGRQLNSCKTVEVFVDKGRLVTKHSELSIRHALISDEESLDELRRMIDVCTAELVGNIHFCQEDLYLYCTAMQNLITSFETQMSEWQKRTYKSLCRNARVTTFVKRKDVTS